MLVSRHAPEMEFLFKRDVFVNIIKDNIMNKSLLIRFAVAGVFVVMVVSLASIPQTINADLKNSKVTLSQSTLIKNGHLTICKIDKSSYQVVSTVKMVVTAYTSTPDQTKDYGSPFITASGKKVTDGIIANNMLPFGTKIRIPSLYGDKVFTVEDRMNIKMGSYHIDIWFPGAESGRAKALEFGKKITEIQVIES